MMRTMNKATAGQADFSDVLGGTAMLLVDAVAGAIAGGGALMDDLIGLIGRWQARADQRRRLATLDQRLLSDIGIQREQALNEAEKPFWQA